MQVHTWIGIFAVMTLLLAGAAVGRMVGLNAGEGAYLTAFALAVVNWWVGRRARREGQR
ncbi:MAG: hypothetical protein SF123_10305 [Chloroflexota bacterium]|nr:hypothetical protein [Chloroflexota bacterium]